MVFAYLLHSPLHLLLKLDSGPLSPVNNFFIIKFHNHIRNCRYLVARRTTSKKTYDRLKEQGDIIENKHDCIVKG